MKSVLKIFRCRNVKMPVRSTNLSAGIDIFVPEKGDFYIKLPAENELLQVNEKVVLNPGMSALIPSGIKAKVPPGRVLIIFNRSSIAAKKNLVVGACVIDEDYQGEIHLDVKNVGTVPQEILPGEKITQMLCIPIDYAEIVEAQTEKECFETKTERGEGGFGSTGRF